MVPPTLNLENPDIGWLPLKLVALRALEMERLDVAMSNSFGFGGANSSLVFSRV